MPESEPRLGSRGMSPSTVHWSVVYRTSPVDVERFSNGRSWHVIDSAARWVWRIAGLVALALGVVGLVLPLLPTTPFLLLAAFCFSRGSQRLHDWLVDHTHLGPPIRHWREHRAITRRAKALATAAMLGVICASLALGAPAAIIVAQVAVLTIVAIFILTRPSPPSGPV